MTHLHERRFLKCTYVRSRDSLCPGLEAIADTHEQKTITVGVPFGEGGVEGSLRAVYRDYRLPLGLENELLRNLGGTVERRHDAEERDNNQIVARAT